MFKTGSRLDKDKSVSNSAFKQIEDNKVDISAENREHLQKLVYEKIDKDKSDRVSRDVLIVNLENAISDIAESEKFKLNEREQKILAEQIADDMLGVGPLEPLMRNEGITDVMVNGPDRVFVEEKGRVYQVDIRFRDEAHLRNIANRIARNVNRHLDESSPVVDARLKDGSRVNIVIPPISIDGTSISIRKFAKADITLDTLVGFGAMSEQMKRFLEIAARARLNILISGGTGSGKTTLMNALSRHISNNERIVTIEDAAELRLQQPHVVRLETRPQRSDSTSKAISQRDLVRNALRMRPDRIILGEVREGEAFDLLQAMNTGHEGSMGTLHSNTTRDAISRLSNMVLMAGYDLPLPAIKTQIASAVNLIVHADRMVDGARRITKITEVVGTEGDVITTQDLFSFNITENRQGAIRGDYVCESSSVRSIDKFKRFGLESELRRVMVES